MPCLNNIPIALNACKIECYKSVIICTSAYAWQLSQYMHNALPYIMSTQNMHGRLTAKDYEVVNVCANLQVSLVHSSN